MAVLESCPKHNMVAYLEKTEGNAEFREVINFLVRSSIYHALTVSPVVSTTFVEQFWMSAKSKIINNVRYITAKVAGKPVSISEASIRSDLLFDDADGIDSLPNQAIFDGPSPTPHILDSIPEVSGGNQRGQSSGDRSLSRTEGGMTLQSVYDLCISLCTQVTDQAKEIKNLKAHIKKLKKQAKHGRKSAKAKPLVHKDPLFDELDDDEINNMDIEGVQDVGRTRNGVNAEKEGTKDAVSTEDAAEGTDKQEVSTDKEEVSTDIPDEGTDDQTEGRRILLRENGGKELIEDVGGILKVKAYSTKSLLTLKPLPKMIQCKGKKRLKKDEYDTDIGRPSMNLKEKHPDLKNKTFEEIQALYEKVKRFDKSFTVIGSNEDERKIKEMNEGASDPDKKKKLSRKLYLINADTSEVIREGIELISLRGNLIDILSVP
ncbi:hypothetical protein Tco_1179695 [Tanacetum coccineum]